jgi:hypothetical protein
MESLFSNVNNATSSCDEKCYDSSHNLICNHKNENPSTNNDSKKRLSPSRACRSGKYVAEIDEVIVNPNITKKGFLNFLEEKSIGWVKKYVVIIIYFFIL